jgi:hypothetical protein
VYAIYDTPCAVHFSLLQVHIVEYDTKVLSAKFERDLLQAGLSRGFHDPAPNKGAACEGYRVDNHAFADGLTCGSTVSIDHIHDTIREARRFNKQGQRRNVLSGVNSEVFRTTIFPAARAGPSFQQSTTTWLGAEAVARKNLPFLLALAIPRDQIIIVAS